MRKIVLGLIFLIAVSCLVAQDVIYRDTATLEWNAVTTYTDGTPLLPTDVIKYGVYRSDYPVADRENPEEFIGSTDGLSMAIVIPPDGQHAYVIRAKVWTDDGETILYSLFTWTDTEGTPVPFVLQMPQTRIPAYPESFRIQ